MAQFAAYKPAKILDSVTTVSDAMPTNFAISSGNNRMAAIAACYSSGVGAIPATNATIGGQPYTYRYISQIDTGRIAITVFIWDENAISSMSGTSVSISGGSVTGNRASLYWSLENVIQSEITYFSEAKKVSTSGSLPLVREADSISFAISAHDVSSSGDVGGFTNPSETGEFGVSNLDIAYGFSSDTERTASFTWSSAFVRDNASIVLNFAPIITGTTIVNKPIPISSWVSAAYQGSKFGGLYSFSDKDSSENNLIYDLAGFPLYANINIVDLDDQLTVAQTNATLSGTNLNLASGARIRYAQQRLDMLSYSPSANPTFNVPNLTEFFNSGMPLGSVTFDLLRTV